MKRIIAIICLASVMSGLEIRAARASWVSENCYVYGYDVSPIKRSESRTYALKADNEGYEWGGGCWDDDNKDDTPGAPDSNGEGPDCSGFVFKSWYLKNGLGLDGFRKWDKMQNIHGPYSSYTFYDPIADYPFKKLPNKNRDTTVFMDAFVKQGHIGMLETSVNPTDNTDYILEALGDSSGTDVNIQGYRYDSRYRAISREGWAQEDDCDPICRTPKEEVVMVP
jgi:hypothetical protein